MKTQKAPLSIRVIYWLSNIVLVMLGLALLLMIVFNILLYTSRADSDIQLHVRLPVKIDFLEKGNLLLGSQNVQVKLEDASSRIHFINTPKVIARSLGVVVIFVIMGFGFLIWIFRAFIINVKKGSVFIVANIRLLRKLSYGIAGFWLFTIIYTRIFYYTIAKHIKFENARITSDFQSYTGVLLFALFVWVLAHIFMVGLKLQQDTDLTI